MGKTQRAYLTAGLLALWGIGRVDGAQDRWSKGEPFRTDGDLPSPTQFHTRAVAQSRVIACGQPKKHGQLAHRPKSHFLISSLELVLTLQNVEHTYNFSKWLED